jgi:excisionase family DNA binding protein
MTLAPPAKAAYSVPEAMCVLGLCRDSVYKLIRSGKLPARKIGRRTIITVRDIEHFLASLPQIEPAA